MALIFSLLTSFGILAKDSFPLTSKRFVIEADEAFSKVTHVLKYPEDILLNFEPQGAKITNKKVYRNEVQFDGTKSILFVPMTVRIKSVLEIQGDDHICPVNMLGHVAKLDLKGSDRLILDNIKRLEVKICLQESHHKKVTGTISGFMFKGAHYLEPFGFIIREMIEAQVDPLLKAVIKEVQTQR